MNKYLPLSFKNLFTSLYIVLLAGLLSSCDQPVEAIKISGPTMGTSYNITLYPSKGQSLDAEQIKQQIDAELVRINQQMSTWIKDSEISQFNQSESTDWYPVSAEFATVVEAAQSISRLSDGAFDITVGPLITLWGFGKDYKNNNPSDQEIAAAQTHIGYQKLEVRQSPPALKKQIPQLQINLSAIAKGYGVDAIADQLAASGISDYLVEIGGEIRANGIKPNQSLWRIAIEKPTSKERSIQQGLLLKDTGVATSGDYRNYFERDGKRYSHTIDPQTGKPITHQLASITVLHPSAMMADGLATAIMVMGESKAKPFIEQQKISAYLVSRDKNGFSNWHNFSNDMLIKP